MATYELVNEPKAYWYGSGHKELRWAFSSKPTSVGTITRITMFNFCRESLAARLYDKMTPRRGYKNIPVDKLRLMAKIELDRGMGPRCVRAENFRLSMKAGLKIVNALERRFKWPRTFMHKVVNKQSPHQIIFLLVASKKWAQSSHMLSLYTLIFRMAQDRSFRTQRFKKARSLDSIMDFIANWSNQRSRTWDKDTVKETLPSWLTIMRNFNVLYKDLPMKRNYNKNKVDSGGYQGITSLCRGACSDPLIKERYNKIMRGKVKRVAV